MLEILLVDDEPSIRLSVGDALRAAGHKVTTLQDASSAQSLLGTRAFDVVISDLRLPHGDGMDVFRRARRESPSTDVILITGYGEVTEAVTALKEGAHDYLTKPIDTDEIVLRVRRIDERRRLERELESARGRALPAEPRIVGRSPAMVRLLERIEVVGASDACVLISGESGTGKELVARSLHDRSARARGPFVPVNCAAFPESLLEAELFGHEKGAFTGAARRREGRFQAAERGTLFLDEVAEIPLAAQAKLLRVIQDRVVEPLGTNQRIQVDVRIIAATHRNLKERIHDGLFREDLYYRLNVLDIAIPPLRERRGDLPVLIEHFLRKFSPAGNGPPTVSPRAWAAISNYAFPGNVRELENAIEHAVVLSRGKEIDVAHLPRDIAGEGAASPGADELRTLSNAVKEFEREYLLQALGRASGKKVRAAEILGISRKNLWEKLKSHGISDSDLEDEP